MKVLITGGPTNEYIDEVMKITNMSSGKVAIELAELFMNDNHEVTLLLTKTIKSSTLESLLKSKNERLTLMRFETTDELMNCIQTAAAMNQYDVIVHSAAVADYKPAFSFRAEDMAEELTHKVWKLPSNEMSFERLYTEILNTLTNPECKVNDETKISSVEPNLTVKLGLTPKIIATLRQMFPKAIICGFKLLENVSEKELVDAAIKQIAHCNTDLVFANDLAELRKGNAERLVISRKGYNNIKVDGAYGIFNIIRIVATDALNEQF